MDANDFKELNPKPQKGLYSSEHVMTGIPIPKTKRVENFSPDEWEEFTEEWAYSLEEAYAKVKRFGGAGDQGLDVIGFISDSTFSGGWDNYQCKHYDHPLRPSDIWVEIGKIIYYSFSGEYPAPRTYYFVAPREVGTTLGKLLSKPNELKQKVKENWGKYIQDNISSTFSAKLEDNLLIYFDKFDFSIFDSISLSELVIGHSKTTFHTVRFGGGLEMRPEVIIPHTNTTTVDSRYVQQLLSAYGDCEGVEVKGLSWLDDKPKYKTDFNRQRERFYHAESLRNFSRDNVPEGIYEQLQEDVYQGVIDTCESKFDDGFIRMRSTLAQSAQLSMGSSPLHSVTRIADKQGICHQLADEDRLMWVKINDE
ncbi:MAG: hypothetical protein JKY80_03380 [Mariprofundaceae bacterium]|nr:hypothetical protein [Mariprofundaceae bacterium]